MKEKIITIILTILIILLPMAIMPSISNDYNMPKLIILLSGGVLLLIFFLANYAKGDGEFWHNYSNVENRRTNFLVNLI